MAAALVLSQVCFVSSARAGDEQELDLAAKYLGESAYATAAARFAKLLDPSTAPCIKGPDVSPTGCRLTDPSLIRRARALYAIALNGLGKPQEAKAQFKQLLLDDPTFTPSPADFSPQMILIFTEAKKETEDEITAKMIEAQKKKKEYEDSVKAYEAWVDEMEKMAATETLIVERSRFIAAVPFGVGQFQNDNVGLGAFFLVSELVFTTGAVVTGAWHAALTACGTKPEEPECQGDPGEQLENEELEATLLTLKIVNLTSVGLLAATIIAGIIEAEVSFEEESTKARSRTVPKRPPKPVPPKIEVSGVPDAPSDTVGLGLTIRF